MSASGRNDRCRCGSKKKAKRCCGVERGPSARELAKSFLAEQKLRAALELFSVPRSEFDRLFDEMLDLPRHHLSMQMRLPRVTSPELEGLRRAIIADDEDAADEGLTALLSYIDTPERRAELARAVLALVDQECVHPGVASVAIVDLGTDRSGLVRSSLIEAVSVTAGVDRTPSGLLVASR